ncbi:hypothetical protein ACFQ3W_22820 [Paenibacillus puldeungensis]|uniref:Bypass of forespore C C-terminal domain-containing protein n=1 Tax=Paenibacillus puldeungensis TaxID=696536 RepID=A0ABW3S427_9BACL
MKKRNHFGFIGLLILLAVSIMVLLNSQEGKADKHTKYLMSSAKIIASQDFKDLDTSAEFIVKGTKDHVMERILNKTSEGEVINYGTKSVIKINKVYKTADENITEGSEMIVQENGAIEETEDGTVIYGVEADPDIYFIKGVYYGKVPLKNADKIQSVDEASPESLQYMGESAKSSRVLDQIFSDALNKYKD